MNTNTVAIRFRDSFQNFAARLGFGASKMFSASTYVNDFFTRNTIELEAAYRTNWIVGQIVDVVAEDMTREGIELGTGLEPKDISQMQQAILRLRMYKSLCQTIKWARLYGGAGAIVMIDGHDFSTPLDVASIGPRKFRGLLPVDRWQLSPSIADLVSQYGPDYGQPKFYTVTASGIMGGGNSLVGTRVHHSRLLRFEGIELPYRQRMTEQGWGESVVERLRDRLVAYDSATQGAAQLVYKAHLRRYGITGLREIIATGGEAFDALLAQLESIRDFQSSEGLTLTDSEDKFETYSYSFAGLSDILGEFGQQLSGATGIPLVRLFGQSPRGFSTGETDLRNYYDMVKSNQEDSLRDPIRKVLSVLCMSELSVTLPDDFSFDFVSLWQLTEDQKAAIAVQDATRTAALVQSDVFTRAQALKELRQTSSVTGRYTNISDAEIAEEEEAPPKADLENMAAELATPTGKEEVAEAGATIQEVSLNGAQVTSMVDIVTQVAQGLLPRESAISMLSTAFPISKEQAESIMGNVGQSFTPSPPAEAPHAE